MDADRSRSWLRAIESALYCVAVLALGWYALVRIDAAREQAALAAELQRMTEAAASQDTAQNHLTTRHASIGSLVGRLEIPRLTLSVLAREGVDTRTLRASAGHVPGTAWPGDAGNAAFAAHRDTFFRPLRGVRTGDEITVTTPSGRFRYVVSTTRVVDPSDVSVLRASSEPTLTLVTCYPFDYVGAAPQRFIVTARLKRDPVSANAAAAAR